MELTLTTPTGPILTPATAYVNLPGDAGDFGVLPGHIPLVSTLRPGAEVTIKTTDNKTLRYQLTGGFVEVSQPTPGQTAITILAESATAL